jgi:hypothetical protein
VSYRKVCCNNEWSLLSSLSFALQAEVTARWRKKLQELLSCQAELWSAASRRVCSLKSPRLVKC